LVLTHEQDEDASSQLARIWPSTDATDPEEGLDHYAHVLNQHKLLVVR
jgi:hypothetical protein